jgi:conjugal transfer pilus assembly protein TrbC
MKGYLIIKTRTCLLIACLSWAGFCCSNTNDEISALQALSANAQSEVLSSTMENAASASSQNQNDNRALIDAFMNEAKLGLKNKQGPQGAPDAILFVSFSMPDSLLLGLADQAAQFNIPIVIKGLVNNDFKQTVATFSRLSHEGQKQHLNFKGVSIDPVWFTQFNITAVPALVVSKPPASCHAARICANQPFDVVYGNTQLKKGLEIIAERGENSSLVAKKILEQGHV